MLKKMNSLFIFILGAMFLSIQADPVEDKQALLDFIEHIHHSRSLNWNKEASVCSSWIGVACNSDKSRVVGLHLPGMGFRGPIPPNTLSRLSALEVLSLRSNAISGSFTSDFVELKTLTTLYLQFNDLSGSLPDLSLWNNLTIVDLSNNSLSGEIPDIDIPSLQQLDLSNNDLTGIIPKSLGRFPIWVFSGNTNLSSTTNTLSPLPGQPPNAQPSKKARKLGEPALLGMIIGACVLLCVLISLLIICRRPKRRNRPQELLKVIMGG
ncbi:putative Vicianin hydrolase [Hibiscus syriacus]|uniref:Vicianin hydrolase n=1 Tax=Hibiscus syriacus TaxID=106335 RepID=A0A6A3CZG0_HIBSY|nr:putative Vicianin hydrolase [Hibiscus syriacus]